MSPFNGYRRRAVLLDVSRGNVPTLPELLRAVDRLHGHGVNVLVLYLELHALSVPGYKNITSGYSAFTMTKLATLDARCARLGMTLIPAVQSLGHMARVLSMPSYAHLALSDARWCVSPDDEEVYALLDAYYGVVAACCSTSPYIHACLDEPFDLLPTNRHIYAQAVGYIPPSHTQPFRPHPGIALYARHVERLRALAARHGRRLMLFGDVIAHWPALATMLPSDVAVQAWWYDALSPDDMLSLDAVADAGHEVWMLAGASGWRADLTDAERARLVANNIDALAAIGRRVGAVSLGVAAWGDGGAPALSRALWDALNTATTGSGPPRTALDTATRHAMYSALQGVYARAIEIADEAHKKGLDEDARTALHADKRRYVALNALDALLVDAGASATL